MAKALSNREIARLRPSGALVEQVEEFLMTHWPSRKRPTVAASVLALTIELAERDEPFPQRTPLAEALNCSVFGIDAAISVALSRDLLSLQMRVSPGNVEQREGVVKHRYLIPTRKLRSAVRQSAAVAA
jgi:hypothetical protein